MSRSIDYYFSLHSPWTYLGHATFLEIAKRHGCRIVYRPVPLRAVFDETGGLPLPKRHPVRQRYRLMDLQRWRERRKQPLVLQPKHFPFDPSLADRFLIAIVQGGGDPGLFMGEVMAGVWARDDDMTRPEAIAAVARATGFDAQALAVAAESEAVQRLYEGTIAAAVEAGVFGAPSYVLDGEVFWGQDRLELLDSALASGRAPYRPDSGA
ncbi:MAG TPA: 2-hydroxychromene-2-carboxylate isomerase [Bosea sp. (in: a-proteobacteria)]|jgi:2-hydroxychromene-2-carboxylate isomerase|uniref:2-hydroxychromene-2-carboxylate isomerase n=1 Tax=Bosea sp. (in: a-proteobacteria) TaxID=1871050 RepID=UPI002E11A640|nr:2-hydroxychromene-2-carboxylate isomerase [Bosea sp. (in: a-proteobacteria)]